MPSTSSVTLVRCMPSQRRERINVSQIVALAFFIVAGTHLEVPSEVRGAGLAFSIRLAAAASVLLYLLLNGTKRIPVWCVVVILYICIYFLAVNFMEFSYFAAIGCLSMVWGLLMASLGVSGARKTILFFCTGYLAFHMLGLGLALTIFVVSGQVVDLHNAIFPFSEARVGEFMGQVRLAGFQIEPGNYANFTYLLVLLRSLFTMRIFSWFHAVAMTSALLTLSAWSVIGFSIFLVAAAVEFVLINKTISPTLKWTAIVIASVLALAILPFVYDNDYIIYFQGRFSGDEREGSGYDKVLAFEGWQNEIKSAIFFGNPLPRSFCPYCISPQDLGTMLNMTYYFGVVPTLLIVLAITLNVLRRMNAAFLILAAPLVVCKAFFFDPVVWLILGTLLFGGIHSVGGKTSGA